MTGVLNPAQQECHLMMRTVRTRRVLFALSTAAMFTVACGSTPTQPTAVKDAVHNAAPAPDPPTAPTAPPADPAPTPTPTPAPTPAPPAPAPTSTLYVATVASEHWYGTAPFSSPTFEVQRFADHVKIGTLDLPIVSQDDQSWFAADEGRTMSWFVVRTQWTFTGSVGQAAGSLAPR
jgi:hypothetical protein